MATDARFLPPAPPLGPIGPATLVNADDFVRVHGVRVWIVGSNGIARDLFTVSDAARNWDGHGCRHALESRHGGYSACSIRATGRQVRYDRGFGNATWRVTARVTFAGESEAVLADLLFFAPVTLADVRQVLAD